MSNWDDEYGGWDYDIDPLEDARPKEEPDCYSCTDSGRIMLRARWWRREKKVNCPDCNPTRWQHRMWLLRWRLSQLRLALTPARFRPVYDDDAPF